MDTLMANQLHGQIKTHIPRTEVKMKTYLATPTNFFGPPATPEDFKDIGLPDMSKNAPDAMARGLAKEILNALALQSLSSNTMGTSNYCEIIKSKLKTKIFLPENTQIWYQTALVIFFRREHRLCENNHKQFQANDAGLETKHANVELCPPKGATHIWIKISKLDEYGLPLANMTGMSIVYYRRRIDNDNVKCWESSAVSNTPGEHMIC